jgi:N-acetylmuramoyl-L-alanine amidase
MLVNSLTAAVSGTRYTVSAARRTIGEGEMKVVEHRLWRDDATPCPFQPSPNRGGELRPSFLLMHYTVGRDAASSVRWLCNPAARASAHLVIGRDGSIAQLVPFDGVAWHAGASSWRHDGVRITGLNHHSIGIELDNPGRLVRQGGRWRSLALGTTYEDADVIEAVHPHETRPAGWCLYPPLQLEAAFEVVSTLQRAYGLKDILGHEDVAPSRKSDPGPAFPMQSFRARLFGRADDGEPDRYVTAQPVAIRVGPGTSHPTVVPIPLPAGVEVEVTGRQGVWCEVDVLQSVAGVSDVQGWVHGRYLRPALGA